MVYLREIGVFTDHNDRRTMRLDLAIQKIDIIAGDQDIDIEIKLFCDLKGIHPDRAGTA
jgi:hypothetical protein